MTEVVVDAYSGTTTNVLTAKGAGNDGTIRRGIKQGCPLSSTLFNLWMIH
jgi:hypothetical protein